MFNPYAMPTHSYSSYDICTNILLSATQIKVLTMSEDEQYEYLKDTLIHEDLYELRDVYGKVIGYDYKRQVSDIIDFLKTRVRQMSKNKQYEYLKDKLPYDERYELEDQYGRVIGYDDRQQVRDFIDSIEERRSDDEND